MTPIIQTNREWLQQEASDAARRVGIVDWLMLLLALLSVGLLAWEVFANPPQHISEMIFTADYVICGIFAIEFLWRWRAAGWSGKHLRRNWYEVLGMIPFQHPAVRGFRLFRVLRIIILLSRFGRAADRALGEEFTYRLVSRFKNAIVESISGAVTVAMINEVQTVMAKGQYAGNISRALKENETEMRDMIAEKLREDPQAGRLSRLPFAKDVTASVIDTSLRVVEQVLKDPRTDELISDMLRENLQQIKATIQARDEQKNKSR